MLKNCSSKYLFCYHQKGGDCKIKIWSVVASLYFDDYNLVCDDEQLWYSNVCLFLVWQTGSHSDPSTLFQKIETKWSTIIKILELIMFVQNSDKSFRRSEATRKLCYGSRQVQKFWRTGVRSSEDQIVQMERSRSRGLKVLKTWEVGSEEPSSEVLKIRSSEERFRSYCTKLRRSTGSYHQQLQAFRISLIICLHAWTSKVLDND